MLRSVGKIVLGAAWGFCLAGAAGAAPTMYFHWEGGLSPYRFATIEIAPTGRASCDISYQSERFTSLLTLPEEEVRYFRRQFERVVALDRQAIEKMATDTGITTWRMTEAGGTRELTYRFTQNAWARKLEEEMWRIVRREALAYSLRHGEPEARYLKAYEAQSDLRQGRVYRPEGLREALLGAAHEWPLPGLSYDGNRATIGWLLWALAYCEPREQWAGDAMALYASKEPEARVVMLRAIAGLNFLTDLKDRQGQALVPLMVQGLAELLDDPQSCESAQPLHACSELLNALGCLRDARAVENLGLDHLWSLRARLDLATTAAWSLAGIGLPGVEVLLEKANSDDERIRQAARWALEHAVGFYVRDTGCVPRELLPMESKVADLRKLLADHGFASEEAEGGALPERAASMLWARYPGWRVMETWAFDPDLVRWLRSERPEAGGPQRCEGDFDGNGLRDVALLIRKDDAIRLVALRQLEGGRWAVDDLTGLSYHGGLQSGYNGFSIYITARPPGTVAFWREDGTGKTGRLDLKTDGIVRAFADTASVLYYWTPEGYQMVQTGD